MCLKVIENGKHKDVHIKEGEVSFHTFIPVVFYFMVQSIINIGLQFTQNFDLMLYNMPVVALLHLTVYINIRSCIHQPKQLIVRNYLDNDIISNKSTSIPPP